MEAPLHSDEQRNKRNSVGQAYVPVHRRTNSNSDNSGGPSRNSNRISKDFSQFESDESRRSSRAGMRASMGAGNDELGYLPSSASSRRSSRNFAWSRTRGVRSSYYGDEGEDSDVTTDDYKRTSILEKLEALSMQEDREQDWEELLRQYDRYDDGEVANRRHSKRASRILDPFSEPPAEMPTVEEPTVILDCYDFSPAFKTHHLHDIFREYENMKGGYRIKWMDDTRALIIFEHPTTAKKAYIDNVSNPLAKIRPYNGSTEFLKGSRRPSSMDMKRMSYNGMKSPIRPTHEQRQSVRGP